MRLLSVIREIEVIIYLGHTKLISCSTEHQENEVGLVGRKENKINMMSFPV